ncbi:MAG: ComEC/Rec2 family competence protein [Bacteroidales bacterium]|nr:ComEC/Rec2 family competence protein [Bacteroidales bacterium]
MKVEREIAGFTLPFAAGILLVSLAGNHFYSSHHVLASISFGAIAVMLIYCLYPSHKNLDTIGRAILIGGLALCLGIFCGECGEILSVSSLNGTSAIWFKGYGESMQAGVDSIPFTHRKTNAVIKALLTGERADIPPSLTAAFRDSGASHILALSGFHLGIIYGIVRLLLSTLGNRRTALIVRAIITIVVCGFYVMATGAGASIVRAFLFIILHETASLTHRHHSTGNVLLTALFIQLVITPGAITSAGFQLSYAAMAGIAFIFPWIRDLWPGNPHKDIGFTKGVRWVWNSAAMSIACQLTTGPLSWIYFHSFPQHFLLTNLIVLPLSSLIIPAALATLTLHALGLCPAIMLSATERLVSTMIRALEIIATM